MPNVSVIVPVYNVEPYIARCVRSLFGQTLQDMEFIFVDDCSQDRSMDIMWQILREEFPARIPQVKATHMPQNSGQAKVRMKGISMVTGEYVIHCDSDDMVDPDTYRVLYEKAINETLDIVTCNYLEQRNGSWHLASGEFRGMKYSLERGACWGLWTKLVRRDIVNKATVAPISNYGEDMVLAAQYMSLAKRIGHIERAYCYYYERETSISRVPGKEATIVRWQSLCKNVSCVIAFLCQNCGYSGKEPELINYKYFVRSLLVPYVNETYYYRLWRTTFPEIDRVFLFMPNISLDTKFWFVLIHVRLYHSWKKITNSIRSWKASNLGE